MHRAIAVTRILARGGGFLNLQGHGEWGRETIESGMAKLTLVYGLRLLPSEEIDEVGEAAIHLKNGHKAAVTMHIVEGSKEDIEKQLKTSIEAFFDLYPEI
jgi:hypothetical protein